jgi:hypothetical protein
VLVTLDNIQTLPELFGSRGEPFNGAVHVTVMKAGSFEKRIVRNFSHLIAATSCFHASMRAPPLGGQEPYTRQVFAERARAIEKERSHSEKIAELNCKLLMAEAEKFIYDVEVKPLTGVTPHGKTYPVKLDWLNYWNEPTAERLGFPDKTLDKPLEGLYQRLSGGWLIKLTPEPLDLDKPEDRERLQWAYDRFASSGVP